MAATYATPEEYLRAVVEGREPPCPLRIASAKALLPYLARKARAPLRSTVAPRDMDHVDSLAQQQQAADDWAAIEAEVRAKHGR